MKSYMNLPVITGAEDRLPRASGYNAAADLVTKTIDGFDLNTLWNDFAATVALQNESRTKVVQVLTFPVTNLIERVAQVNTARFETASEYGEPKGMRPTTGHFNLGYDFEWYDLAARFTWKFLAEAPANQIEAINAMALEADNVLIFEKVMTALFEGNENRDANINDQIVPVYGLYNGDGTVPPKVGRKTFTGDHTHYLTSGAISIVPQDLDDLFTHISEHGYTRQAGYQHILFVGEREGLTIRTFNRLVGATYDFIPAQGDFAQLLPADQTLIGQRPASTWRGLDAIGSYGPWLVVQNDLFPEGYVMGTASGGPENVGNPVGFRQHENPSLRGLRLVKGPNPDYPLIDSFYNRGFGTGIRQRGASAILQLTTSPTYTPPVSY